MAKIILSMEGMVLKEIPLAKERTTIGRKAHNDIQIDNLAISGEHAVIVAVHNDAFLEDLNSTNGTHVNGHPVKKHFLQNGDVIELGKYRLKYINEAPPQAKAEDFEKTMIMRPDALRNPIQPSAATTGMADMQPAPAAHLKTSAGLHVAPAPQASPAPGPAAAAPSCGALQILSGANAGKEMELTKSLSKIGKPGVQVAVIARRPHGYFLTHVEGANYPVVNGKTLDAQAHALNDHDIIELAGVKMEFFIKG